MNTTHSQISNRLVYKGTVYWLQKSGRYFSSRYPVHGERLLHRRIWAERHGPIPDEYEVHHKDHDWCNLDETNLELLSCTEHYAQHSAERSQFGKSPQGQAYLAQAREAAKEWHASEEGLAWHSKNGRDAWKNRLPYRCKCIRCGSAFFSFFPTKAKHCSKSCSQADAYKTQFSSQRTCAHCGKSFMANKYRKTRCCSHTCANRMRAAFNNL